MSGSLKKLFFRLNSCIAIPSFSGFSVEISAASTVLMASKLGIPISSTHCIVGGIVSAGWIYGQMDGEQGKKVDWSLFRSIIYAWIVTLPAAGSCSALLMLIFQYSFIH